MDVLKKVHTRKAEFPTLDFCGFCNFEKGVGQPVEEVPSSENEEKGQVCIIHTS
jgi:hypothetical protein